MLAKEGLIFKCGRPHFDPELLGFFTARDHTSIVIAEYDERTADQSRIKYPFARGVEIIAINESEVHRGWWMT